MSLAVFLLFLATWTVVAVTPGPAVICSISNSTRYGFAASLRGIAGIQTGNILFFLLIAGGLGAILERATYAFDTLRIAGSIYLLYLGIRIILATFKRTTQQAKATESRPMARNLFLQGFLIQVSNPKALLFVSALLPQFIDPTRSLPLQLCILAVTTVAVDLLVLSSYAWFAQRSLSAWRGTGFSCWIERIFGAALIYLGVRLFANKK